jgi:predicted permease
MVSRLLRLLSRRRLQAEFDGEIADHLALLRQRFERQGMTPEEAELAARRQFGGVAQLRESHREHTGFPRLEHLVQDIRYGARSLARNPGYTAVAVLSLALGIGANTAIYSVMNAILLRSLPVENPDRLMVVGIPFLSKGEVQSGRSFSYPQYQMFHDGATLSDVFVFRDHPFNAMTGVETERVAGAIVSGNYFSALGVRPVLGTLIEPSDDLIPGSGGARGPVAVISYEYWQGRFKGDAAVVGRPIGINGHLFKICGVTPRGFAGTIVGTVPAVYGSMAMASALVPEMAVTINQRRNVWLRIMARLKPNVETRQAEAELTVLLQQFNQVDLGRADLNPLRRRTLSEQRIAFEPGATGLAGVLRRQYGTLLNILMGLAGIVLLISCANVANLSLARAAGREREISVRLALGASRVRLWSLLTTESALLAAAGAVLGIAVSRWARDLLVHALLPTQTLDVSLDSRVLGFTAAVSAAAVAIFGLAPALRSSRASWGRTDTPHASRLSRALVSAQVAMSVLMLIGAALFVRTLLNLRSIDPGFARQNLLLMEMDARLNGYTTERANALYERVLNAARALPGVRSVSVADCGPLDNHTFWNIAEIEGGRAAPPSELLDSLVTRIAPGYFDTMGISLLMGRDIVPQDTAATTSVVLVNRAFVEQYVPDGHPVGKRIHVSKGDVGFEIAGVVSDGRYSGIRESAERMLYVPYLQKHPMGGIVLHVRVAGSATPVIAAMRREIQKLDSTLPIYNVRTVEEQMDRALAGENLMATVGALFGSLALVLAAGGVYGVMAYAVSRRTREVGIRMALGADAASIVGMVLREAELLVGVGVVLGIPIAYVLARLAASRFYGVEPGDAVSIALAAGTVIVAGLAAAWIPARRASRVDPMAALRAE